jgi:hypothetical protein
VNEFIESYEHRKDTVADANNTRVDPSTVLLFEKINPLDVMSPKTKTSSLESFLENELRNMSNFEERVVLRPSLPPFFRHRRFSRKSTTRPPIPKLLSQSENTIKKISPFVVKSLVTKWSHTSLSTIRDKSMNVREQMSCMRPVAVATSSDVAYRREYSIMLHENVTRVSVGMFKKREDAVGTSMRSSSSLGKSAGVFERETCLRSRLVIG